MESRALSGVLHEPPPTRTSKWQVICSCIMSKPVLYCLQLLLVLSNYYNFRFILDYLRKGKLDVSDGKLALIAKPLSSEASFFQLRSLEEFLSRNRVQSFGNSSIITDSRQEETLLAFLRDSACETVNWCLLYKATRDGWQAKEFHARCDGKSPTLVVVKGESNVLGGYATAPWQSSK